MDGIWQYTFVSAYISSTFKVVPSRRLFHDLSEAEAVNYTRFSYFTNYRNKSALDLLKLQYYFLLVQFVVGVSNSMKRENYTLLL